MEYFGEEAEETGNIISSMFIEWTNAMKDEGLRPATINHNLSDMRAFMYWCMAEERKYIDRFRIKLIKVQEEMPKDYTLDKVSSFNSLLVKEKIISISTKRDDLGH